MASRSLDDLRPEMRPRVDAWLAACVVAGLDILVYCTLRSNAEQDALFARGRTVPGMVVTNARAGQSAHNFGLGLDFVPLSGGKPVWIPGNPLYLRAVQIAELHGLDSLARSSFPEWPHLQMPDWRAIADRTMV